MDEPDQDRGGRWLTRVFGTLGLMLLVTALGAIAALFTIAPLDRREAEARLADTAGAVADRLAEAAADGLLTGSEAAAVTGGTAQYRPVVAGGQARFDVDVELETTQTGVMSQGKALRRCYRFRVTPGPGATAASVETHQAPMEACAVLGGAAPASAHT